jgi:hypothetical protein
MVRKNEAVSRVRWCVRSGLSSRQVYVGFVLDKVAL